VLPLVRQLSIPLTAVLLRSPVTPNQVTVLAIGAGLAGGWCLTRPNAGWALAGVLLFIACQVLDSCDGEIARAKDLRSRVGGLLDDFGDWLVHAALFLALGVRASASYGGGVWMWLGIVAASGITLEYAIDLLRGPDAGVPAHVPADASGALRPSDLNPDATWVDQLVYAFRVLLDADFCFILPLFVLTDLLWVLLPAAAVGNHVYWLAAFRGDARAYHA
jgi:hypothetical protein